MCTLHLPRIAHSEHLPPVAVGLVPVDIADLRVDLHIVGPAHCAAILDAGGVDAPKNGIELFLFDAKTEMVDRKIFIRIDEVERLSIVDEHRGKWPNARLRPRNAK